MFKALTVFTTWRPVAPRPQSWRLKTYPGTVQCPWRVKSALWESKSYVSPSWGDWIDHEDACASLENVLLFECYLFLYSLNKLSCYQKCLLRFSAIETVIFWICFKPDSAGCLLATGAPAAAHHLMYDVWAQSSAFATPWTTACQAPLSMEVSRQEYWVVVPDLRRVAPGWWRLSHVSGGWNNSLFIPACFCSVPMPGSCHRHID